nr:retrotransposon protein, putative, unclassified [Tanacetum cinerariifolium]
MVGTRGTLANTNTATGVNPDNANGLDAQTKAFIQQLIDSAMAVGWEEYKNALLARFDTDFEDPLSELKNLKCDSTIQKYHEKFELLINKVDMPEAHAINLFLREMPQSISLPKFVPGHKCSGKAFALELVIDPEPHMQIYVIEGSEEEFVMPEVTKTDASGIGIGSVLQQEGHHVAYLSKTLVPKHQSLSAYEKELLAVIMVLDRWRGYLLDRHFQIKTGHFSLKGRENQAADALSRTTHRGDYLLWIEQNCKKKLVSQCDVCQRNKAYLAAYPGLLQPLPIPQRAWKDISMDFIDGLPSSRGNTVIIVVVDRLNKYAHFIYMAHPYIATQVAQAFMDNVYKLHSLPKTIEVDRNLVAKEQAVQLLQFHLKRAQNRMKSMADKHRDDGLIVVTPMVVMDRRQMNKNRAVVYVLVQWTNCAKEDATWESYEDIQERETYKVYVVLWMEPISGSYGELDGVVSPPDELDTPKSVKLVEMGH